MYRKLPTHSKEEEKEKEQETALEKKNQGINESFHLTYTNSEVQQ